MNDSVRPELPDRENATGSLVRLMGGFFLLLKATNNILYLSVLTVFLKEVGPEYLPWVYVLVNISFIAIQVGMGRWLEGREGLWLLSFLTFPAVVFSLGMGFLIELPLKPVFMVGVLLAILFDLFTNQAFANLCNQVFSLQDAKRHLTVVFAMGSVGYILSGILIKFIVDLLGIRGLLWGNALLLLVYRALLQRIRTQSGNPEDHVQNVAGKVRGEAKADGERMASLKYPLGRLLVLSSFLTLFNKYLIDFLFSTAVAGYFRSRQDLASFMGVFGAVTDFSVIALQTFVMNLVFARYPTGSVMSGTPILLVGLCGAASLFNPLGVIVLIQFLVLLNSKNFIVPGTTIVLGAVPQSLRNRIRRDVGTTAAFSSMLVGAVLLFLRSRVSIQFLFLVAAGLYLLLGLANLRMNGAYSQSLRETLSRSTGETDSEMVASIRFLEPRERAQRLEEIFHHPNPEVRIEAFGEARYLSPSEARRLLIPILSLETDPRCLTEAARVALEVLGPEALSWIEEILESTDKPRVSADILEAIGRVGSGERVEALLLRHLHHAHHRVRGSAIMSLLRLSKKTDLLMDTLRELRRMGRDGAPLMRATAAAVMGEMRLPLFVTSLEDLSKDPDEMVILNAVAALGKIRTSRCLGVLKRLCTHLNPKVAESAKRINQEASRQSLERIASLLNGVTASERVRLVQSLKGLKRENSLDLLGRVLSLDIPEAREGLVKLIQEGDEEVIGLLEWCLVPLDGGGIRKTLAPVWAKAKSTFSQTLPPWAELLHLLWGVDRMSEGENAYVRQASSEVLKRVWLEAVVMELAENRGITGATGEDLAETWTRWARRAEVVCRLSVMGFYDPAPLLSAIEGVRSGESFTRSVAQEFLDNNLGQEFARLLVPLLKFDPRKREPKSTFWSDLATKQGIVESGKVPEEEISEVFRWIKTAEVAQ